MSKKLLSTKEAAKFLGTTQQAMQQWRYRGTGPAYYRDPTNKRIYYALEDLEEWQQLRDGGTQLERHDPLAALRAVLRGSTTL